MPEYLKTKKEYFYKKYVNGEKKRISQDEYNKKTNKSTRQNVQGTNTKKKDKKKKSKNTKKYTLKKHTYIMKGGAARKLDIDFGKVTHQTIGDCIKESIEASFQIYTKILSQGVLTTIVCGGQSPSYYCLAMMNFSIYNPELVNIVILPHSKGQQKSENELTENTLYCERLTGKDIHLRQNVVIIDGVHTGTGILALESALNHCFPGIRITKIAINALEGISKIPVDEEIILPCEPKFSDIFPRLVTSYHPRNFHDESKFITEFIGIDSNPVAEMVIDIARTYPQMQVEETEWYKLNNEITGEIQSLKEEEKARGEEEDRARARSRDRESAERAALEAGGSFKPIVLTDPKRYQCPICKTITGTQAPKYPHDLSFFSHNYDCPNKYKIPMNKNM